MFRKPVAHLLYLCLAGAVPVPGNAARAAEGAPAPPVQLRADDIRIDQRTGVSRYIGNVSLRQGALSLTADQATTTRAQNALEQVRAEGNPATLSQQGEDTRVVIQGRVIVYDAVNRVVTVSREVVARRDGDEVRGHELRYDLATKQLDVHGMPGRRVSAVLRPEQSNALTR